MINSILKVTRSYLRAPIVFMIDIIVSVLASLIVLGLVSKIGGIANSSNYFSTIWLSGAALASAMAFVVTYSYHVIIRYSTLRELARLLDAALGKEIMLCAIVLIFTSETLNPFLIASMLMFDFFITVGALLMMRVLMVLLYDFLRLRARNKIKGKDATKVLIYGVGDKSASLLMRLEQSSQYIVVGFISPDPEVNGKMIGGKRAFSADNLTQLISVTDYADADAILFPSPSMIHQEENGIIRIAREAGIKLLVVPSINEIRGKKDLKGDVRNIRIEDLLGRPEIDIDINEVKREFTGKTVLVTGAAGSIGSELCRQLANLDIRRLIMLDNSETPLHNMRLEFEDNFLWVDFETIIGDVRMPERLDYVFRTYRPQIVFHAAAYKHVPMMEANPCEAVLANVIGSRNVADKCIEYGSEKMVMISTDKAVNPTNIMGCTKRLAEIYVQSLGLAIHTGKKKGKTIFVTTRFGNVLGSNGSVIPRFKQQIESGGPITVTHPEINRFFMTIPEACRLVMEAAVLGKDTNIFVFDMGTPVKIADLATRMIELAGLQVGRDIEIKYTGLRPGEKLYEEVLATKENTLPTSNNRIHMAQVREYDYEEAEEVVNRLLTLAQNVKIDDVVILMKKAVPEFKSMHSEFEKFDKDSSQS